MSILIKGMKMPKYCMECKFCGCGSINEFEYWCGLTGSCLGAIGDIELWEDMMAADCPLIEVPTPHGRLVDADNLVSVIDDEFTEQTRTLSNPIKVLNKAVLCGFAKDVITAAPTIIKAEEGEER